MWAFVVLHQVDSLFFNMSLAHGRVHTVGIVISVNHGISLSDKAIFIPLWARTKLPTLTTKIAELGPTMTGFDINQQRENISKYNKKTYSYDNIQYPTQQLCGRNSTAANRFGLRVAGIAVKRYRWGRHLCDVTLCSECKSFDYIWDKWLSHQR
ncbi:hypothetical protein SNK04_005739 [Fusarium graminearum]